MPCNPDDLAQVQLLELLDDEERAELAAVVDIATVAADEMIFNAGDSGESMFIVRSGEVELFLKDNTGQKIVLDVAEENDIFGDLSMLDNRPRSASAVALLDTELIVLDRDDLLLLFQKEPDSALNMLAAMSTMLRKADNLLQTRVSRNVNEELEEKLSTLQRIADWIAWFSGSMQFLIVNLLWFVVWIAINTLPLGVSQFDPFPFGLLTMIRFARGDHSCPASSSSAKTANPKRTTSPPTSNTRSTFRLKKRSPISTKKWTISTSRCSKDFQT